jgi:ABC-type proline/glycine betaine transport system substrate-binding protein
MDFSRYPQSEKRAIQRHYSRLCVQSARDISIEEAVEDWEMNHAARWRRERHYQMMVLQRREIDQHKWIESMKAGCDLGRNAQLDWIHKHAAQWREWFEECYDETALLEETG